MTRGRDVAAWLDADLVGPDRPVSRLATPADAGDDAAVVVSTAADLEQIGAGTPAVVVGPASLATDRHPFIAVADARLALARLSRRFDRRPRPQGVAASASIARDARLGREVSVAPGAVIGAGATIGDRSSIGAGCVIGEGASIGADCRLHAHVTLYDGVRVGDRAIVHSGAVIGADGFGFAAGGEGAVKIHHLGSVWIGDDVEIGANTCIDRGTLADTRVGNRTKIDNLCQIGHNVVIGSDVLIAGMTGIGGSARIGDRVTLAGYVGIADHVSIGEGATIGARSGVHKDVPPGETWIGAPAMPRRDYARSLYLQNKLDAIWAFVKDRS